MSTATMVPAAQVIVSIIPIIGIVIGGVVVFFYFMWRHKQINLLIQTGNYKPVRFDLRIFSLLAGLLLAGTGFVLTILFAILEGISYSLLGGLVPCILGICLIVFYKLYPKSKKSVHE